MFSGRQSQRGKSQRPVAWVVSAEETKQMKPTDKAILGMVSKSPGRNGSEPIGGLGKLKPRRSSPHLEGGGRWLGADRLRRLADGRRRGNDHSMSHRLSRETNVQTESSRASGRSHTSQRRYLAGGLGHRCAVGQLKPVLVLKTFVGGTPEVGHGFECSKLPFRPVPGPCFAWVVRLRRS